MFDQWNSFAKIVELSSLNKASRILNISQPALSRQMMKLEEELGLKLFSRKGKRLELTRAGEICYEHAVELGHMHDKLMQVLEPYRRSNLISFTIGASLTTLQSTLPDLLSVYMDRHPMVDVKALTGKTHEVVTMVKERKVDIGLVASSIKEGADIICEPLFDDHLCLILPIGHPYIEKSVLTINDLEGLPLILFSRGTWYRVLTDELFQKYGIYPNVKMEIDSFEAIIRLVSSCRIATLLPLSYVRADYREDELIVRHLKELVDTKRTTSLIFTKDVRNHEAVRSFVQTAKSSFSTNSK